MNILGDKWPFWFPRFTMRWFPGWVLYIPNEYAQRIYEELVAVGKGYGLAHAGYLTLRHLRIEKFYVYWG